MKTMKIYDEPDTRRIPKRGPLFGAKSFLAMAVLACGIGLYTGLGMAGEQDVAEATGLPKSAIENGGRPRTGRRCAGRDGRNESDRMGCGPADCRRRRARHPGSGLSDSGEQ